MRAGFTLIEMSIVLVIIGLIVGGILVGQNLIRAAGVRATISQIEKYNAAVNTFRGKYGALPGDMNAATAGQFGFAARGQYAGEGDGNGVIEGIRSNAAGQNLGTAATGGETAMFWVDLSAAHLIQESFNTALSTSVVGSLVTESSTPAISAYIPQAKLGNGNYIYVWSGGITGGNGTNYYGLSANGGIGITYQFGSSPGLSVAQAYAIDTTIDDGLPQSGRVIAQYATNLAASPYVAWAAAIPDLGASSGSPNYGPTTAATGWAATNCYDNNGVVGPQTYSLHKNSSQLTCALSFQFQ